MREINFRGKRTDGKGWVYGYLVENEYDVYRTFIVVSARWEVDRDGYTDLLETDVFEAFPESVGQYTGEHDNENGKKLYAGDILDFVIFDWDESDTQYKGVIEWDNEYSAFIVKNKHDGIILGTLAFILSQDDDAEKIGNISDNPELLKEE